MNMLSRAPGALIAVLEILLFCLPGRAQVVLNVGAEAQEHSEWCWTGVSLSVLRLYGEESLSQCDLAEWARQENPVLLGGDDCCGMSTEFEADHDCNAPNYNWGYPGSIHEILNHWGVLNTMIPKRLTFEEIAQSIDQRRPFVVYWEWFPPFNAGHFVVGHGYGADETVYYMNPWPGEGSLIGDYTWLVSGNEDDTLIHLWTQTNVMDSIAPADTAYLDSASLDSAYSEESDSNDSDFSSETDGALDADSELIKSCAFCADAQCRTESLLSRLIALFFS